MLRYTTDWVENFLLFVEQLPSESWFLSVLELVMFYVIHQGFVLYIEYYFISHFPYLSPLLSLSQADDQTRPDIDSKIIFVLVRKATELLSSLFLENWISQPEKRFRISKTWVILLTDKPFPLG